MKNLFLYLNPMHPSRDHNSNLILKLIPYLNFNVSAIAINASDSNKNLPGDINGVPIHFIKAHKRLDKLLFKSLKLVFGQIHAGNLMNFIKTYVQSFFLRLTHKQHAVLSTYQTPYPSMTTSIMGKKTVKALYLMDPTDAMWKPNLTANDDRKWYLSMLKRHDVIFTTKFIKEAMLSRGYDEYAKNIVEVSFPMITESTHTSPSQSDDKITLLFAGRLYAEIRSPEYFFKIISKLDERFRILFIGQDCCNVKKHILPETTAEVITSPAIPYSEILKEMAKADILINIGNSIPVHLPSKTLEYINTGKPIINFYKFDECPTLDCTKKYPLCLNISEQNENIDSVRKEFVDFCINSKGKQLEREFVINTFYESTPECIAKTIYNELSTLAE